MQKALTRTELGDLVGKPLGVSEWLRIDQARIDAFAEVTEDRQFIHVDPKRAAATPFGGTIAHGLLTLSMIVRLCWEFVPKVQGAELVLNYGFDKVRFVTPVKVDSRIRAHGRLAAVNERKRGQVLINMSVEIEVEGSNKPALIAEWLSLHVVAR
ncbi:MAG TPA: MaoC family dehydratase [Gammaproteobacteria bacterium]|jgi:acyl dehydratase